MKIKVKVIFTLEEARWGWVFNATPRPLYSQERPSNSCIGDWAGGAQDPSGRVKKISPPKVFDPRTVQPVASRDTSYAIPTNSHVDTSPKFNFTLLSVS
jgi:hypothetical protein